LRERGADQGVITKGCAHDFGHSNKAKKRGLAAVRAGIVDFRQSANQALCHARQA